MTAETLRLIQKAVKRAETLHPVFPTDRIYQANLLSEEAGEVCKEANDIVHDGKVIKEYLEEVADTIAVGVRILEGENDR